jgi:hypothetical protein
LDEWYRIARRHCAGLGPRCKPNYGRFAAWFEAYGENADNFAGRIRQTKAVWFRVAVGHKSLPVLSGGDRLGGTGSPTIDAPTLRAAPDGYTLGLGNNSSHVVAGATYALQYGL